MKPIANIVLGLGFGDEGKGITTDYLCSLKKKSDENPDTVVVRFNGGQQAGHTVIRNGIKHVHSSFGCGTLQGIPTYISEHCCFYPPYIMNELDTLLTKGVKPVLSIHPLAKLTTPYDIAFNRVRESRLKHGSVGLGIGTTFTRYNANYKLYASDLTLPSLLQAKLQAVKEYYSTLLRKDKYEALEINYYNSIVDNEFVHFYTSIVERCFSIEGYDYLNNFSNIIFEGAQGIMLDMDYGIFPNITYSHTTSRNAIDICKRLEINDIDIHYVTRCYQTRHGNGWMSDEGNIKLINNEEEINVEGKWQGSFRVGELDPALIDYAISCDDNYSSGYSKHLHVTCLDQRPKFSFPYSKLIHTFATTRESKSPYVINNQLKEQHV